MKNSDVWVKLETSDRVTMWRRRSGENLFYAATSNGEYPTPESVLWVDNNRRVACSMAFLSLRFRWDLKPLIERVGVAI